jgi:uncharacterized protein YlxW (UPF0749 family)
LTPYRKFYEPKIRELLKETFLSAFGDEFVKKEDYLIIRKEAEKMVVETRQLKNENETLKKEKKSLNEKVTNLEAECGKLEKKLETVNRELDQYIERYMADPTIKLKPKT